jgi:hypothetical protein
MSLCGGARYKLNFTAYCKKYNQNFTLTQNTHLLSFHKNPYLAMLLAASLRTFTVSVLHMAQGIRIN